MLSLLFHVQHSRMMNLLATFTECMELPLKVKVAFYWFPRVIRQVPQTRWLKVTETCGLEARYLQPGCPQGSAPSEPVGRIFLGLF